MFTAGLVVVLGVVLIFIKMPLKTKLWWLGHPLALDVSVSGLVLALHWGTYSGVMAAAVAGLLCSVLSSIGKSVFGSIKDGEYTPGIINLKTGI